MRPHVLLLLGGVVKLSSAVLTAMHARAACAHMMDWTGLCVDWVVLLGVVTVLHSTDTACMRTHWHQLKHSSARCWGGSCGTVLTT